MHLPRPLRVQPAVFFCDACRDVMVQHGTKCPGCARPVCPGCALVWALMSSSPDVNAVVRPTFNASGARAVLLGALCAPARPEVANVLHAIRSLRASDLCVLACTAGCGVLVPSWGEEPRCPTCGASACATCTDLVRRGFRR